ncbi:Vacuolar protein sorting-associated protein 53 [Emydomyces testavorans]|uniref:mRNA export factor MEX67 n=1 Tax=Emydomyces testavorans TaxID=2070801 RepID=A0AAF0DGK4_9EURO|nr:Vacuolar protein sorting-associated protein 53 [Emydomyces testavorans]
MLQLPNAMMNGSRAPKGPRGRAGTPDRGGIRKRSAAPRVDRDGDLAMTGAGAGRGRGIGKPRGRGDLAQRTTPVARHEAHDKEKTLDALQRAIFSATAPQANIRRGRADGTMMDGRLSQVRVRGWRASKAVSNADGGVESLIAFLGKKATPPDPSAGARLSISKSRVEGDALVVSVPPEQVDWVLRINGFSFAGAPLTIDKYDKPSFGEHAAGPSRAAIDTKARMTAFLAKRYFEQKKVLDLSKLGADSDLVEMGMFTSPSTESKFFPALMKICEITFDSSEKRRNAVESVSLADNQLPNVAAVTTLAQTFPDLKNLDLSNNRIKSIQNMSSWRWKFRNLEFLDLTGNEASAEPDFKATMLKWYPKLRTLNNTPVRTTEEIAAQMKTPIPVKGPVFRDESTIAENFLKIFFFSFDNNKDEVLNGLYDEKSIFSLNVNPLAPRAPQPESTAGWDLYIRKSRNLLKLDHLSARMSRAFVGRESIRAAWNSLPRTKHPDILSNPQEWLIECHPIPGLPDPTGQSTTGVGGLLITVHGKFDEIDKAGKVHTRSFDRTFVLGPGRTPGGVRVSNDMLCLRAFGGCKAWIPEDQAATPVRVPVQPMAQTAGQPFLPTTKGHPEAKDGYGMPKPGKTDEQVKKEQLVLEISFRTKMTLQFSEMALAGNNWNLEAALKNFEELKHLNAIFSHPSTLASVSQTSHALRDYQDELDRDIATLIEAQAASNKENVKRIQAAKADMAELFKKIDDVRERALKTEQAITEMTADIKQLDNAKKNLTLSMTTLKRLQMLTTAYEQLKALSKSRQYRDCAQLLQAVIQLMSHFKSYRSIDQIAALSRNVADIQRELLEQVCEDFEIIFVKGEIAQRKNILSEACLVIEALGDVARSRLITWYCNTQLREYRQVFRGNEEAGSLDNISRRYSWFKRMLKTYDEEHAAIFPTSWKVGEILANVFCEGTRDDFKAILARSVRSGQTLDVNLLLSCLQETLDFEQSLDRHFTTASRASIDTLTSSESPVFSQSISEAFTPYLGVWVEAQDKQLASLILKYRQQPVKPKDEEFSPQLVIQSSTDLFTFYRHSFAQCARLSTGNSLAELSKVFAKYLDQYAQQVLLYHISERASAHTPSKIPSLEELIMVLNTADYCYSTCNQLEDKIKGRIDESFKQTIDLQSQADSFMGIASAVIRTLVRQVDFELEPAWKEMRNIAWNKLDSVGDQSSYVEVLLAKCKTKSEEILSMLHKQQYARTFADHLVEHLSSSFVSNIYQCRPVSETAAEQMLLDGYSLKNGLSNLLDPAPAGFTKRLNATFQKIDTLLKTLQVRASPAEALVQAYLIHIADKNDNNFRKILDLKGIRGKTEQSRLLELFQIHRASDRHASNLQASNPLIAQLQPQSVAVSAPSSGSVTQGLGLSGLGSTTGSSLGTSALQTRFDASTFGSALISAARDGVDRLGTPGLGNLGVSPTSTGPGNRAGTPPPGESIPGGGGGGGGDGSDSGLATAGIHATNLNENLKSIGKFFRRDLGGLGGRFGRGGDDGGK